jgi:hypothetical protein
MFKKALNKIKSSLAKANVSVNTLNFADVPLNINCDALESAAPEFKELNPSYVLIRRLKFHPEVKMTELPRFENLIKWKSENLSFIMVFRDYPLKLLTNLNFIEKGKLVLNTENLVKYFTDKQVNIAKSVKVFEEILQVLPYTKKIKRQKLFRLPISRSPLYKSYFSTAEMKKFREELAAQNNTRWSNVEIYEIYDKFSVKLFSDIRQTSSSRSLLCYPSFSNAELNENIDFYYLIIGKRKDTDQLVKALSRPTIKQDDSKIL